MLFTLRFSSAYIANTALKIGQNGGVPMPADSSCVPVNHRSDAAMGLC